MSRINVPKQHIGVVYTDERLKSQVNRAAKFVVVGRNCARSSGSLQPDLAVSTHYAPDVAALKDKLENESSDPLHSLVIAEPSFFGANRKITGVRRPGSGRIDYKSDLALPDTNRWVDLTFNRVIGQRALHAIVGEAVEQAKDNPFYITAARIKLPEDGGVVPGWFALEAILRGMSTLEPRRSTDTPK